MTGDDQYQSECEEWCGVRAGEAQPGIASAPFGGCSQVGEASNLQKDVRGAERCTGEETSKNGAIDPPVPGGQNGDKDRNDTDGRLGHDRPLICIQTPQQQRDVVETEQDTDQHTESTMSVA